MQDDDSGFEAFYGEYSDDEDGFNSLYYVDCSAVVADSEEEEMDNLLEDEIMDTEEPVRCQGQIDPCSQGKAGQV